MTLRRFAPGQGATHKLDRMMGSRIFTACWLVTGMGIAMVQMRLLALAWQQSHLAMWTAGIASSWLLGCVLASHLDRRAQRSSRIWGVSFVLCTLLNLRVPLLSTTYYSLMTLQLGRVVHAAEFAVIAFLLGMLSTAWLAQRRPWPPIGERSRLVKGYSSTMVGLALVWLVPAWADTLGLLCLSPLLVLDFWPEARCPLPAPGKLVDTWYDRSEGAGRWQLRLQWRQLRLDWWWNYLAQRGRAWLTVVASGVAVVVGSIWGAVPTPFAAHLFALHALGILGWLVISQGVALSLGGVCLAAARSVLGAPDRLLPEKWQKYVWVTAVASLLCMAASLLALGLPSMQAPWTLVGSLLMYTLAGATWSMLFPRLKPGLGTQNFSKRHLLFSEGRAPLRTGQVAYGRAQEESVNRVLVTVEGGVTALLAVAIGWLIDQWGVDRVLVAAGIFLLIFLGLSFTVMGVTKRSSVFTKGKKAMLIMTRRIGRHQQYTTRARPDEENRGDQFVPVERETAQQRTSPQGASQPHLDRQKQPARKHRTFVAALISLLTVASTLLIPLMFSANPGEKTVAAGRGAPSTTVGYLSFLSSGQLDPKSNQGLNDRISLDLHSLANPAPGQSYYAWLLPEQPEEAIPLLLGKLTIVSGSAHLIYTHPQHVDLLATLSRFLVTEESSDEIPTTPSLDPTTWRYEGSIPTLPMPGDERHYSLLDHLRHLLAKDPTITDLGLSGGLDIWLYRNAGKILEWSSAARDEWNGGQQTPLLRRQLLRVLDYLDGSAFIWRDVPLDTPFLVDPQVGRIGLLEFDAMQTPPGYLAHVAVHLLGLSRSPGVTPEQKRLAIQIDAAINTVTSLMQKVHQDAVQLAAMSDAALQQPYALSLLNDMMTNASNAYVGQFNPATGRIGGGIVWIHDQLQGLATIEAVTQLSEH